MKLLTHHTFDAALEKAEGLVLVDFFAQWCGPCRTLTPILNGLEEEYAGRVDFVKVDADNSQPLMEAFGVRSLPTLVLLQPRHPGPGADVVAHSVGAKPAPALRKMIDKALAPPAPKRGLLGRLFGR